MAEVHVQNWAEFVAAVAVAGDTVILPEAERWDLNEIAPEGVLESIPINCAKIIGNGTSIWNGRFYGSFQVDGTEIEDFHIINYFCSVATVVGTGAFSRCMVSGLSASGVYIPIIGASFHRCAFNVELQATGNVWAVDGVLTYCRIILHAALASNLDVSSRRSTKTNCEIILYMPNVPYIYFGNAINCTVRGNMQAATYFGKYDYDYSQTTIVNTSDLAENATVATPLIGVTDAQMQDAAYLASIGFPIGGGDDP